MWDAQHAVRVREHEWRYAFPPAGGEAEAREDVRVRCASSAWTGFFSCTPGRRLEILTWPAARAIVVAAASGLYIVDPELPEEFAGFAAPVGLTGVTFDETGAHLFAADSLRVYAFSADRKFRWISEALDGYGARFCGCGGRVVAVEVTPFKWGLEEDEEERIVVRLRAEDGTALRSRFSIAYRYWRRNQAA
jgi:hypothetical protein